MHATVRDRAPVVKRIAYPLGILAVASWIFLLLHTIPGRWEDCYSYLLYTKAAIQHGYSAFTFGSIEHPLYTFLLFLIGKATGSAYFAGKLVSIASYCITLFFLFKLSARIGNLRTAVVSVLLCTVVFLDYSAYSTAVLAGPLFIGVLISAVYYEQMERMIVSFFLIGILSLIRSEYILVLTALAILYIAQRQMRKSIVLWAINLPFVILWYLAVLRPMPSATAEVVARFGVRSIYTVIYRAFGEFSFMLVGGSILASILVLSICLLAAGLFISGEYRPSNDITKEGKSYIDYLRDPIVFVVSFVAIILITLIYLKYTGRHPLAVRHFAFLVPFVALLVAQALEYLGVRFQEAFPSRSSSSVVIMLTVVLALTVYLPNTFNPQGRFQTLSHYMDGNIATGTWLRGKIKGEEKFISPLPSVIYYSGYDFENADLGYPDDILNRAAYKKRDVEYIAWSNIYAGQNIRALKDLEPLKEGHDWLFFKHVYSPPTIKGWYAKIYSVSDVLINSLAASLGEGWYGKEKWGRWAEGAVSSIVIDSPKASRVHLTFEVGAFIKPAVMKIYVGDSLVKTVNVKVKRWDDYTPTKVDLKLKVHSGKTVVKIVGPEKFFVPKELGMWNDTRELRVGFSDMRVDGVKLF